MYNEPQEPFGISKSWKTVAGASVLLILISYAVFSALNRQLSIPPKEVVEADAGFKRAKQTIDPEKLRAWALKEIAVPISKRGPIEAPDYVKNLYSEPPEQITVGDGKGGSSLEILWGGGFFSWGFVVGQTNFYLPNYGGDMVRARWVPGIYYSREGPSFKIQ